MRVTDDMLLRWMCEDGGVHVPTSMRELRVSGEHTVTGQCIERASCDATCQRACVAHNDIRVMYQ